MSIIHNTEPYTELALYIEENLTKLVKLKLITRDRFKQFDQLISDYILADGLGDEERVPIYAEQIEDHYNYIAEKLDKRTEEENSLGSDPVVFEYSKHILACSDQKDLLPFIPDISSETSKDEFLDGFTNLMLKMAEKMKGTSLSEVERDMIARKIADGSFMQAEDNYNNAYYHYSCPDYSSYVKQNRLSKPMTFLVPGFESDDMDLDDSYETILAQVEAWPKDKLIKNITKLVYLHLSEWQKEDGEDAFMYGLRVPLALIEHFRLHECLPLILEMLRQDYGFQETYFMEDGLEDMLTAALSNIVETDDLPVLLDFMAQPGLLYSSKRQVALAVGHLPKRDASMLKPVQQWLSDVLNLYFPMGAETDVFDEVLLDTLVFCCIHCNAVELKPLIIKLYAQYKIPYLMVGGGCNEMRQQIKKAPLGTLDEDCAEQMLLDAIASDMEDDDWEDEEYWDDEDEKGDPDFNIEDYDWQEYSPYAMKPKAVYKLIRNVRKFTLRISLNGTKPSVWRELEVPSNLTLSSLASVILLAMGWDEDHLHQFIVGKGRDADFYATSVNELESVGTDSKDGRRFCIGEILCNKGDVVTFEYDYGDSWHHTVKLISATEYKNAETKEIVLTGGERACPPENCGGIPGYLDLCESMKNPTSAHAQELIEWMGCRFDPELFPLQKAQAFVKKCNPRLK